MATIIKGKNPRKPYTVRYQDNGRQRERSFAKLKGPDGAEAFKAKFENDSRAGIFVDPRNGSTPFMEYAVRWVDGLDRAESTKQSYRGMLRNHIAPAVGSRTLAQVAQDREAITGLLATMKANGMSATRRAQARSLINGVMSEAVKAGKITTHRLGDIPVRREAATKPATIIPATTEQLERLAAGLKPELALTVAIMAGTGLRISECLAVRLDGFRDGGTVLRVREQVSRQGGMGPLKGRRSGEYRDVPVPAWLWAKVQDHVKAYGTDGYLFPGASYSGYYERFTGQACKAGLPDYTPHQLRHRFASLLLTNGVPITDVSKWLGHRDINVTHQIYSHLVPESWDRAREVLGRIPL